MPENPYFIIQISTMLSIQLLLVLQKRIYSLIDLINSGRMLIKNLQLCIMIMARSGGGGGALPYAYWVCAARETPFSSLNFRSGAYHFHKLQKNPLRIIIILHFLPLRRPSFSKFLYRKEISSHSSPPTAGLLQRSGVSGRPECQTDASYSQFRTFSHFYARARSGAPHFHAQARSRAPHFSLCRGTYLPKFGASHPPGARSLCNSFMF